VATKEELQRRIQRILRWFLPVTIIMLISTVLSLVGVDSEPWFWTRSILFGIAAVRILRPSHQILAGAAGRVLAGKRTRP
jgi:cation transport ATPase